MKIGFSLSPGGLLLPYHLGALRSLSECGYLTDSNPIAGSSAGAIAVAAHASKVDHLDALDATIRVSSRCEAMGGARGNLLPLLQDEMEGLLPENAHEVVNKREGMAGLAYREIFPVGRNVLKTEFETREELIESVCNSSSFPFFSTNWPCSVRYQRVQSQEAIQEPRPEREREEEEEEQNYIPKLRFNPTFSLPRLVVDGYFTVPRDRFGCPIFPEESGVERTVTISVFPHETIGLTASEEPDRISSRPCGQDPNGQIGRLLQIATQTSEPGVLKEMYNAGRVDAERWVEAEEKGLHRWVEEKMEMVK